MTNTEINELPERVRRYIHDLETLADYQGLIRDNWMLTEENAGLRIMISELKEVNHERE